VSPTEWKLLLLELRREAAETDWPHWDWQLGKSYDFARKHKRWGARLKVFYAWRSGPLEETVFIETEHDTFKDLLRMDPSLRRQLRLLAGEGIFTLSPSD
jgi:hypothetical protein